MTACCGSTSDENKTLNNMLSLKILENKNPFTKSNGDVVVDLIRRAVSFINIRSNSGKRYVVDDETVMRPDLIANYFYQDSSLVDLLLKYNGYSNPFALDIGDIIRIPDPDTLAQFGGKPLLSDLGASRKKKSSVVIAPKTKKDKARVDFLLNKQNAVPPVPPNVALDSGVKVTNGRIIFGADVTNVKKQDCPDPISRTKLKETLIKNRLA
jgi:hypothetical protein